MWGSHARMIQRKARDYRICRAALFERAIRAEHDCRNVDGDGFLLLAGRYLFTTKLLPKLLLRAGDLRVVLVAFLAAGLFHDRTDCAFHGRLRRGAESGKTRQECEEGEELSYHGWGTR